MRTFYCQNKKRVMSVGVLTSRIYRALLHQGNTILKWLTNCYYKIMKKHILYQYFLQATGGNSEMLKVKIEGEKEEGTYKEYYEKSIYELHNIEILEYNRNEKRLLLKYNSTYPNRNFVRDLIKKYELELVEIAYLSTHDKRVGKMEVNQKLKTKHIFVKEGNTKEELINNFINKFGENE